MVRLTRRAVMAGAAAMVGGAAAPADTRAWDFTFTSIEDGTLDLKSFRGRVLLVANTASFCGYTPQYQGLEELHRSLTPRGLTVVGVPSQDFNQEQDSNAKVKKFCDLTYGVEFPMAGLSHVRGPAAHPFYRWVRAERGWEPGWNFYKVLVGRDGRIAGTFSSADEPSGRALTDAIAAALAQPVDAG